MPQSRTSRPVLAALLPLLVALATTARQQRTQERLLTLCLGYVQTLGRHTLTGVLRSLGRDRLDWSAAYRLFARARFDLNGGRQVLLAAILTTLAPIDPVVVVLDGTQLARTSPRVPGVGWLRSPRTPVWRPGIHRAQRWVGLSALLPRSADGASRAIPLWFAPAPSPRARAWPGHPPQTEWEAGLTAWAGCGRPWTPWGRRIVACWRWRMAATAWRHCCRRCHRAAACWPAPPAPAPSMRCRMPPCMASGDAIAATGRGDRRRNRPCTCAAAGGPFRPGCAAGPCTCGCTPAGPGWSSPRPDNRCFCWSCAASVASAWGGVGSASRPSCW